MIINDIEKVRAKVEASQLLVFDFDGVLAESVEVKTEAFALLYKPYGREIVENVIAHHRSYGGMSRFDKFSYYHRYFLGKIIDEKKVIELSDHFSELVKEKVINSPEVCGVSDFLEYYCRGRKKCVINSATPQIEIQEIVEARGISMFFSEVFGSPSTKIDNLNKLLKLHYCSAEDTLFFGDSESDLKASNEVGTGFVGIGDSILGLLSDKNGRNYHVNSFMEIIKLNSGKC